MAGTLRDASRTGENPNGPPGFSTFSLWISNFLTSTLLRSWRFSRAYLEGNRSQPLLKERFRAPADFRRTCPNYSGVFVHQSRLLLPSACLKHSQDGKACEFTSSACSKLSRRRTLCLHHKRMFETLSRQQTLCSYHKSMLETLFKRNPLVH